MAKNKNTELPEKCKVEITLEIAQSDFAWFMQNWDDIREKLREYAYVEKATVTPPAKVLELPV